MPESKRPDADGPASEIHETMRAEFDWSEVSPSTAVVETVAIAANCEPIALELLYDTIDPEALDVLIHSRGTNSPNGMTTIMFTLNDHEVTVQSGRTVVVRLAEARTEPE